MVLLTNMIIIGLAHNYITYFPKVSHLYNSFGIYKWMIVVAPGYLKKNPKFRKKIVHNSVSTSHILGYLINNTKDVIISRFWKSTAENALLEK